MRVVAAGLSVVFLALRVLGGVMSSDKSTNQQKEAQNMNRDPVFGGQREMG
jgi:hypothetical protein